MMPHAHHACTAGAGAERGADRAEAARLAEAANNAAAAGSGEPKKGWAALREMHNQKKLARAAKPPSKLQLAMRPVCKAAGKCSAFVNSLAVQFVLYIVYVMFFQALIAAVRSKEEVYLTKFLLDNILEEPINPDDGLDNDLFMSIANVGDIDLFVGGVLIPALVVDTHMDETLKTPLEMAETMDNLDWSSGLIIKQVRAAAHSAGTCGTKETAGMMRWYAEKVYGECPNENPLWGDERESSPACAISESHQWADCFPEMSNCPNVACYESSADMDDYCYNWTHPDQNCTHPWKYFTAEELGADPAGQASASTTSSYNTLPADGFVTVMIPFFSEVYLEEEECETPSECTDYRQYSYEVSRGAASPNYFCIRLSWNGHHVRQFCDPNDAEGRTTGAVINGMLEMWEDMKSAHFVDYQTRVLTFIISVRANHRKIRNRLTMMIQLTSLGGVLPSFELQSRVDTVDYEWVFTVLYLNMALVIFFIINEGIEAYVDGFAQYFTNMWNLMDWSGFMLFLALFGQFHMLRDTLLDTTCGNQAYLCTELGYHDDWQQYLATADAKLYLSLCSTLQMLKVIKFINVFVPKMALATSVLSHGLGDLTMFTIFFLFSIFAFAQMFYIQLGPVLDSYNDMISSFFSLFRALFGDFDIAVIMDNSSDYINAVLLILYLFAAIFVLLSIFLTILGEHQGYVRDEQQAAKAAGTNTPDFGLCAFIYNGIQGEVRSGIDLMKEKYMEATHQDAKVRRRKARDNWGNVLDMIGASSGGSAQAPPRRSDENGNPIEPGAEGGDDGSGEPPTSGQVKALHTLVERQQKLLLQLLSQQGEIKAEVDKHTKTLELEQSRQLQRFEELTNSGFSSIKSTVDKLSVPNVPLKTDNGTGYNSGGGSSGNEGSRNASPGRVQLDIKLDSRRDHGGRRSRSSHTGGHSNGSHSATGRGHSRRHESEPGVNRANSMERRNSSRPSSRNLGRGTSMGFLHSAASANLELNGGNRVEDSSNTSPPHPGQSPSRSASGRAVFGA